MPSLIRKHEDKLDTSHILLNADSLDAVYEIAAAEIKNEWLPKVLNNLDGYADSEEVQDARETIEDLRSLSGRELVELWNDERDINDMDGWLEARVSYIRPDAEIAA